VKSGSHLRSGLWLLLSGLLVACQLPVSRVTLALATATPSAAPHATAAISATPDTQTVEATPTPAAPDEWAGVNPTGAQIVFWHTYNGEQEAWLQKAVEEFNGTNPYHIRVSLQRMDSFADILNQLLPLANTPEAPDVILAYQAQAAVLQLHNALLDVNSLLSSPRWGFSAEERADFFPAFLEQDVYPIYDGQRLGFPWLRYLYLIFTNTAWLNELGYSRPPRTPDQFREAACKAAVTPYSRAQEAGGGSGYTFAVDGSTFAGWVFAFGGRLFDASSRRYSFDQPEAVQAMTFLQMLVKDGCARFEEQPANILADLTAGKALFISAPSLVLRRLIAGEMAIKMAPFPHTTAEPIVNTLGASLSIPRTTPQRELAAWLFIKFLTAPDLNLQWAQISSGLPVRIDAADQEAGALGDDLLEGGLTNWMGNASSEPSTPDYDLVREQVHNAMLAILQGEDVAVTLEGLNRDANELLQASLRASP